LSKARTSYDPQSENTKPAFRLCGAAQVFRGQSALSADAAAATRRPAGVVHRDIPGKSVARGAMLVGIRKEGSNALRHRDSGQDI
jgi:hypothetical protein